MIIRLCIIYLIFCYSQQINAQTEFAAVGAEWYYNCCANGQILNSHLNYIVSEKDTIIEEKICHLLVRYDDHSNIATEKYILKQEGGQVYYYYQNQFNLLFDFDVEVGDTVRFTFRYQRWSEENYYTDTILSARYLVEGISTDAHNLKHIITELLEEDQYIESMKYIFPTQYSYTEKIGYFFRFMPMLDNIYHTTSDKYEMLRCYSDDDLSFVSDSWAVTSLPCNYSIITNLHLNQDENLKIYPNPFRDNLLVYTEKEGYVKILDIAGRTVHFSKLVTGMNEISTKQFLTGIYLIQINDVLVFKIIKL